MLRPLSPSVKDSLETATTQYQNNVELGAAWLAGRGIDLELARDFRIGVADGTVPGQERLKGRLAIPSLGRDDSVQCLRFRSLDGSEPKILGLPGVPLRLFNVRALHLAGDSIHVTEGEIDAISLAACGLQAVGVTGATAGWKPHHRRLFAGFSRVYVWPDGDAAGTKMAEQIARDVDSAIVIPVPDGEDVNSILCKSGREGILDCVH